jgi:hypothetical protein
MKRTILLAFVAVTTSVRLAEGNAYADLWPDAYPTNYASAQGAFVFHVVPGMRLGYPPEVRDQRARGLDTGPTGKMAFLYAEGTLSNRVTGQLLWSRRLYNYVAPVGVLISDSGKFVVSIDDWVGNRRTKNAVVIYGAKGELIRRFAVTDIITQDEMRQVPVSSSTYLWQGGYSLDEGREQLVLHILTKFAIKPNKSITYKERRIALPTGAIVPDG